MLQSHSWVPHTSLLFLSPLFHLSSLSPVSPLFFPYPLSHLSLYLSHLSPSITYHISLAYLPSCNSIPPPLPIPFFYHSSPSHLSLSLHISSFISPPLSSVSPISPFLSILSLSPSYIPAFISHPTLISIFYIPSFISLTPLVSLCHIAPFFLFTAPSNIPSFVGPSPL